PAPTGSRRSIRPPLIAGPSSGTGSEPAGTDGRRGRTTGSTCRRTKRPTRTTSPQPPLDLNADLGEGYGDWSMGDDAAMREVVTTANVACGGHAGDGSTMRAACRAAAARGVALTAHVAYPDLAGFGRRFLDIAPADLTDQVVVQTGALQAMARAEGAEVAGVKPHGALYNALARHEVQAGAVVRALQERGVLQLDAAPGDSFADVDRRVGVDAC